MRADERVQTVAIDERQARTVELDVTGDRVESL
jgi:hypothetical protein